MKFTIDVVKLIMTTHRLKKDGTFKEISFIDVLPDDMIFDTIQEAQFWKENQSEFQVVGKMIKANPTSTGMADSYLHIRSHRVGKPKQMVFSKQEVENVLKYGNDNIHNSLVVDFDGFVHLVPFEQAITGYAVRFETFQAGNGYVGSKSSLNHLDGTYLALLEGWLDHLETHDCEYRDSESRRSEVDILSDINQAYNAL
jgi:hypothetical protein